MSIPKKILFLLTILLSVTMVSPVFSKGENDSFNYLPTTNKTGKKWRVAYYQGGPSNNYYPYLQATIRGLANLGWLNIKVMPDNIRPDTLDLWNWLASPNISNYIEFVSDAYYNANWDSNLRQRIKKTIIDRVNTKKDIDLIIAMGTWAGKDLANNEHKIPTMVMSTSDPVNAGIISSIDDSGYDHIHARVDPTRWERQIHVFHKTIGFKKLGITYEDTPTGRSYAAISIIENIARQKNFEIVRCFSKDDIPDKKVANESVIKCFEELVSKADAIYVVQQNGVNHETIPKLVALSNKNGVATFSQLGSEEVKYGFLMSISREGGFGPVGRFLAVTMAKIFNGAKPRQLNQIYEEVPNIALNLKTAEEIGLYLNAEILAAADELYRDIQTPLPTSN
jgi:ABC-type uncharacterized transport system substrate-binding protein